MKRSFSMLIAALLLAPTVSADGAKSSIRLTATVTPASVTRGETVRIEAVFRAVSDAGAKLHVPPFIQSARFPAWRFTHENGDVYMPFDEPFAGRAPDGVYGEIVELSSMGTKSFAYDQERFIRVDPKTGKGHWNDPGPLPQGAYDVRCTYARSSNEVRYLSEGRRTKKKIDGLFVGKLEAPVVKLRVDAPKTPYMDLDAPARAVEGAAYAVELTVHNPTSKAVQLPNTFRAYVGRKGRRGSHATFDVAGANGVTTKSVVIDAGASRRFAVDLSKLTFAGEDFHTFINRCWFYVRVEHDDAGRSNGIYRQAVATPSKDAN